MRASTDFAPGEMFLSIKNSAPVSEYPAAMDIILYIEYMLFKMLPENDPVVRLSINKDEYFTGCIQAQDVRQLYVEDKTGTTLFYAQKEVDWKILVFDPDTKWATMIEYAYEKVRTCHQSLDRFITEFPPIGIEYRSKLDDKNT